MTKKSTFKNKKLAKALVWVMLFALLLTGQTIQSFATNYSVAEPTRLATINNATLPSGYTCTNLSGMAYSDSYQRLYTVKVYDNNGESSGFLYYYPNASNMSNYKRFVIQFVGHANGMTVDGSYVYITAATNNSPVIGNNNGIIRISRYYIHNLADGSTITSSNYDRFEPKYWSGNTLVDYGGTIGNITRYNTDGTFIINFGWSAVPNDYAFTTAAIETVNGSPEFVVSRASADIFVVLNNMQTGIVTKPDIEYAPDCGLFIPRWYGALDENGNQGPYYNPCKTVILWANNVNGSYSLQDIGTRHNIRVYTPDKINVNASTYMVGSTPKYSFFELESVAVIHYTENSVSKADLLFTANVQSSFTAYDGDGIFRLKRADGGHFKIA